MLVSSVPPQTILVIDDDPGIREAVTWLLESEGYHVVTAVNGEDGLRKMQTESPALVLLDNMMPVMDGREFKVRMDRVPEYHGIPVLGFSALAEYSLRGINITDVVAKPFEIDTLLRAVHRYLH